MPLVLVSAKLAIESLIDFAAVLDLCVFVVLAEEALWVVRKPLDLIKDLLFSFYFLSSRTELLKCVHGVVVWVIS